MGFVNAEGEGAGGLESQYQKVLAGKDGHSSYAQAGGRLVPTAGARWTRPCPAPTCG